MILGFGEGECGEEDMGSGDLGTVDVIFTVSEVNFPRTLFTHAVRVMTTSKRYKYGQTSKQNIFHYLFTLIWMMLFTLVLSHRTKRLYNIATVANYFW